MLLMSFSQKRGTWIHLWASETYIQLFLGDLSRAGRPVWSGPGGQILVWWWPNFTSSASHLSRPTDVSNSNDYYKMARFVSTTVKDGTEIIAAVSLLMSVSEMGLVCFLWCWSYCLGNTSHQLIVQQSWNWSYSNLAATKAGFHLCLVSFWIRHLFSLLLQLELA